jgi:2-polyprenyl-3-methyl-5-hydroxy-6-metoxy-1,4-benzoquinol methylase
VKLACEADAETRTITELTMSSQTTDHLNEIAATYDSVTDFDGHLIRYNYRAMRPYLRGPAILELGCASGVMTRWLAREFPTLSVVDGSAKYIEEVKATVRSDVQFHHSLFQDFRCHTAFNDVVMTRALEHIPEPVELLERIRNWVAPDGRLHLVVPNALSLHRRLGVYMGMLSAPNAFSERDRLYGHCRVYDPDLLRQHLVEAGWKVELVTGCFLKPLSNAQMMQFTPELLDALFEVGRELPRYCSELYAVAARKA